MEDMTTGATSELESIQSGIPRQFYRTTFSIEVISDDPGAGDWILETLVYELTEGRATGSVNCNSHQPIPAKLAAQLAIAHGTDPEFLDIDEDGNEVDVE